MFDDVKTLSIRCKYAWTLKYVLRICLIRLKRYLFARAMGHGIYRQMQKYVYVFDVHLITINSILKTQDCCINCNFMRAFYERLCLYDVLDHSNSQKNACRLYSTASHVRPNLPPFGHSNCVRVYLYWAIQTIYVGAFVLCILAPFIWPFALYKIFIRNAHTIISNYIHMELM